MKRAFSILGPLFLAIIPIVIGYYLTLKTPDVRFSLSERIPVSFLSENASEVEVIQQLEVKNIGNAKAERVVVRFNNKITAYELRKYSFTDQVDVSLDDKNGLELVYPILPPEAGFTLIIKSPSPGTQITDLSISHDQGTAREALSKESNKFISAVIFIGIVFLYLKPLYDLRSMYLESWIDSAKRKNFSEVLSLRKPWYAIEKDASKLFFSVITKLIEDEKLIYFDDISGKFVYKFLNSEKPDQLSSPQWEDLVELASKKFEKLLNESLNTKIFESDILSILRISRPKLFPQEKWQDFIKNGSKKYISSVVSSYHGNLNIELVVSELTVEKPDVLDIDEWKTRENYLKTYYFILLTQEFFNWYVDPNKVIEKNRLDLLKDEDLKLLKEITSSLKRNSEFSNAIRKLLSSEEIGDEKPAFLKDLDWRYLKSFERKVQDIEEKERKCTVIVDILEKIKNFEELTEKPDILPDNEWEELKKMNSMFQKLGSIEEKELRIEKVHVEWEEEKLKIEKIRNDTQRKLDVIHSILNDPRSIDRFEYLDDLFASGNVENLRKLASVLLAQFG